MLPNLDQMQADLMRDSAAFLPELLLCGVIVLLLVLRLIPALDRLHLGWVALVLTAVPLAVAVGQWQGVGDLKSPDHYGKALPIYGGLLVYDRLTLFLRLFLLLFGLLTIVLTLLTRIPDREDSADFYVLLLGATLGMMVMASANHLIMVFIGVEMASLPSYALAGFLKGRRLSSEAALKYVVYGGGAAGVMLYGISLLAGKFGTGYLPDLAPAFAASVAAGTDPVLLLGGLFLLIGLAFKLAAVPFHFWCPDVFEGASAEVAGFLSVASKGAAVALLARLAFLLAGVDPLAAPRSEAVVRFLAPALAVFAVLTMTFGNLAAYLQTNLKRLLAYSTIAHAGYMLMGLATLTADGLGAVLYYLVAYLFMNLGAFAVVAFIRNLTGSEDLRDLRGLVRRAPWMVVALSFFLLSLLGLPPLVGFQGKFQLFGALFDAGKFYAAKGEGGLSATMYALLVIGGFNTVFSAVYYLKVLKVMIIEEKAEDLEGQEAQRLPEPAPSVAYAVALTLAVLLLGVIVDPVLAAGKSGAERYQAAPPAVAQAEGKR